METTKELLELPTREKAPASSFKRTMTLFKKTWDDLYSLKGLIITVIIMAIIPILITGIGLLNSNLDEFPPYAAGMTIVFNFLPFYYLISLGIIYGIVIGTKSSGLICEEIEAGTMLILVSKPIGRIQIFLGKFLAAFVYMALIAFVAIFSTGWILILMITGNIEHFFAIVPVLLLLVLFSQFINAIFLSISMALSSIMKKGKKVSMMMIVIILFTFLGFFLIKIQFGGVYDTYNLYVFDISYHLGNVFIFFNSLLGNPLPMAVNWQTTFTMFTGVFDAPGFLELLMGQGTTVDSAQGLDLGGFDLKGYFTPVQSFLIWLGIAALLVFFGLLKLKKREISN